MFSSFWPRTAAIHRPESTWLAMLAGCVAGILLPLGILLIGWAVELSFAAVLGTMPNTVSVGPFVLQTSWLNAGTSALRGVLGLIVLLAIIALIKYLAVLLNERAANYAALDFDVQVQKLLFKKSSALATEHGLSGQRSVLHEIQNDSLPKVRDAVASWYVAWPRFLLHVVLLLALASAIHPWLTAAAVVGLLVLRTVYFYLESLRRKQRPVHLERWRASREKLLYLCDTAPLLAAIHDTEDTAHEYQSQLQSYRQTGLQLVEAGGWKSPTIRLLTILLATVLAILIAIRVLDRESSIGLGGAVALCTAVAISVYSFSRIGIAMARRREAETPVHQIVNYLSQGESSEGDRVRIEPEKIERELTFDHLTIRESTGKKLLDDISLSLKPGQLTAIVGTDRFQTRALAELCLGFGKPDSGRMLIDGNDSIDVSRTALQKLSLWVAPNGPLVSGSIEDNLWINGHPDALVDLMEVARKAHVADAIMNLPEGLQTLVSPSEERLPPDSLFRIGIARGFVKKRSIVVAEEPKPMRASIEADSTEALVQLKNEGVIVVVLPNRLSTLRAADQVVVLHDHQVSDRGTHAELLERSELYRHLNYVRFAPFGIG